MSDLYDNIQTGFNFDESIGGGSQTNIDWAPDRFRIQNAGDSKYVCLLDDEPIRILEHELQIGDTYYNRFVCPEMNNERCYFCSEVQVESWDGDEMIDESPYNAWLLPVLNQTGYVDKDDEEHRNIRQVLTMKKNAAKMINRKMQSVREEGGDVRLFQFKVTRDTKNDYRIGNDWVPQGQLSEDDFDDEINLEPYNWEDLIEYHDYEEQKKIYESRQSNTPDEILDEVDENGSDDVDESDKDFFDEGDESESETDNSSSSESESGSEEEDSGLVTYS